MQLILVQVKIFAIDLFLFNLLRVRYEERHDAHHSRLVIALILVGGGTGNTPLGCQSINEKEYNKL